MLKFCALPQSAQVYPLGYNCLYLSLDVLSPLYAPFSSTNTTAA